jgi:hypothetical protein
MAADSAVQLRLLAAEVRAEQGRIDRTVAELTAAVDGLGRPDATRLQIYGAAALLETFYSGIEKALMRIAGATGSLPEGGAGTVGCWPTPPWICRRSVLRSSRKRPRCDRGW